MNKATKSSNKKKKTLLPKKPAKVKTFSLQDATSLLESEFKRNQSRRIPEFKERINTILDAWQISITNDLIKKIQTQAKEGNVFTSTSVTAPEVLNRTVLEFVWSEKDQKVFLDLLKKRFPGFKLSTSRVGKTLYIVFGNNVKKVSS